MAKRFTGPGSVAAAFGARDVGVMPATAPGPQPQSMSPVVAALTGEDPDYLKAAVAQHAARLDDHDAALADHADQLAALAGDGDDGGWDDDPSDHAGQIDPPDNPGG